MKTLIVFLTLTFVNQIFAQNTDSAPITINIENLSSDRGTVIVSLYNEENFLSSSPLKLDSSKIKDGKAVVTFRGVKTGQFGITAFHDANGNGFMDFDPSGMPLEVYGISNNKFNPYGPPVWSDARFEFTGDPLELNIRLTR